MPFLKTILSLIFAVFVSEGIAQKTSMDTCFLEPKYVFDLGGIKNHDTVQAEKVFLMKLIPVGIKGTINRFRMTVDCDACDWYELTVYSDSLSGKQEAILWMSRILSARVFSIEIACVAGKDSQGNLMIFKPIHFYTKP